jgi:hypothetical protein
MFAVPAESSRVGLPCHVGATGSGCPIPDAIGQRDDEEAVPPVPRRIAIVGSLDSSRTTPATRNEPRAMERTIKNPHEAGFIMHSGGGGSESNRLGLHRVNRRNCAE